MKEPNTQAPLDATVKSQPDNGSEQNSAPVNLNAELNELSKLIKSLVLDRRLFEITTNSKEVTKHAIFVALKGKTVDARDFIPEVAANQGCSVIFTYADPDCSKLATHQVQEFAGKKVDLFKIQNLEKYLSFICLKFYDFLANILNPEKLGLEVPVIGITGTNGKTTTANLIAQGLTHLEPTRPVYNIGTIGLGRYGELRKAINTTPNAAQVMQEIFKADAENASVLVMEVSSHGLELGRVANVRFNQAIFTNLSQDHLDFHGDLESYFLAKAKLFTTHNVQDVIISSQGPDDSYAERLLNLVSNRLCVLDKTRYHARGLAADTQAALAIQGALTDNSQITSAENSRENPLGTQGISDTFINDINSKLLNLEHNPRLLLIHTGEENHHLNFKADIIISIEFFRADAQGLQFTFKLTDKLTGFVGNFNINNPYMLGVFNIDNILTAIGSLYLRGYNIVDICKAAESFKPVAGRMEVIKPTKVEHRNKTFIVDFAHTPDALEKLLETVNQLRPESGKIWVVFGCGGDRDAAKRPLMGAIASKLADQVIITDDNPRSEDPSLIAGEIFAGIDIGKRSQVKYINDREQAIATAVSQSEANDLIIIAGKGHETEQIRGKDISYFSDVEVVSKLVK